jgi:ABC-2 type transport system ATP-binding protein
MSDDVLLEIRSLSRRFGTTRAVEGVTCAIPSGSVVGLIGPNGAGKTTLLSLVAGLIEPCAGEARFLGENVRALPDAAVFELVLVGDGSEPPASMTIGALLDLQADASPRFDRLLADGLLREMNLPLSKRFGTLSKGNRQWVLSVLGLAARPRLLLMDEPAAGLDVAARRRLYELVRSSVDDHGATVVISSHILTDLQRVCDEIVLLSGGRLVLYESLEVLRGEVREVELAGSIDTPLFPKEVAVLAREQRETGERLWVRAPEIDERLRPLASFAAVHTVNLESLYLAMAGRQPSPESPAETSEELASCR